MDSLSSFQDRRCILENKINNTMHQSFCADGYAKDWLNQTQWFASPCPDHVLMLVEQVKSTGERMHTKQYLDSFQTGWPFTINQETTLGTLLKLFTTVCSIPTFEVHSLYTNLPIITSQKRFSHKNMLCSSPLFPLSLKPMQPWWKALSLTYTQLAHAL